MAKKDNEALRAVEENPALNTETDPPTTSDGQVHPATGNPAQVTQEGRDIRDASQHVQALRSRLATGGPGGPLSDIQKQKLDSHPAAKAFVDQQIDAVKLEKEMAQATTAAERDAIIARATAADPSSTVGVLREPEDPNADPVRDRQKPPDYRTGS